MAKSWSWEGLGPSKIFTNTELYNPATGIWKDAGNLNIGRTSHTATLLNNGRVLVVGGEGADSRSAELFNAFSSPAGQVNLLLLGN